jgi:hypothetical protein
MQAGGRPALERKVLLLGSSLFTFTDTDPSEAPAVLLRNELLGKAPAYEWSCDAEVLYQSPSSLRRAAVWLDGYQPDAVVFEPVCFQFVHRAVVLRVKKRWPRLYRAGVYLTERLKQAGGGTFDGGDSLRGLLFRGPRALGYRLVGADVETSVHECLDYIFQVLDEVLRREHVALICSMPKLQWKEIELDWARAQVEIARDAMSRYCRERFVPVYDVEAELARSGRRPGLARDNIHYDRPTARLEAALMSDAVLEVLDLRPQTVGNV